MTLPGMVTGRCRGWDSSAPSSRPPPTNLSWTSSLVRTCRTMRVATQIGEARQLEGCSGLDPITDAPVRLRDGLTGNGSDAAPNMKNFGKHIKTASSDPPHERSPTLLANHSDTQRRGPLPLPHRHPPRPPPPYLQAIHLPPLTRICSCRSVSFTWSRISFSILPVPRNYQPIQLRGALLHRYYPQLRHRKEMPSIGVVCARGSSTEGVSFEGPFIR